MLKLYGGIFKGIWLSIVISALACWGTTLLVKDAFLKFIIGFVSFVAVYAITLMLFGFNEKEKNVVINILNRTKTRMEQND